MFVKALTVMGDSGTEYTIDYAGPARVPRCTCPAFEHSTENPRMCKHIRYVAERVLKRPRKSGDPVAVRRS